MLQTAAFLVTTFLSGMRVDEVLALRPGCGRQDISADGLVYLHRLQSTLSKGQPKPREATWVVTEHVHRAVEVLEQLPRLPARTTGGQVTARARRRADRLFRFGTNLHTEVGMFVAHVNSLVGHDLLGSRGVNARALRRTLAWYIAHRPFGTTALAVQYKHVHATVTEGYVGVADQEFQDLLATEMVEAELEALASRLLAHRRSTVRPRARQVAKPARYPGLLASRPFRPRTPSHAGQ